MTRDCSLNSLKNTNTENVAVMKIGGLILNSTKFFPLFESADALALPNSSH
jgi:hypothetical protein